MGRIDFLMWAVATQGTVLLLLLLLLLVTGLVGEVDVFAFGTHVFEPEQFATEPRKEQLLRKRPHRQWLCRWWSTKASFGFIVRIRIRTRNDQWGGIAFYPVRRPFAIHNRRDKA
uniref:Putative secreted protein n=1 Tax=Anopheles darlingi TaxID=43151 RepID=A0A2M4D3L4_ANODA